MSNLGEIIDSIEGHHIRNPDHGINCACMDRLINRLRRLTTTSDRSEKRYMIQMRIDYVLRMATENRS